MLAASWVKDITELYRFEQENIDFLKINKSLSDIRKAKLKLSINEVKSFTKFMQNPNDNRDYKWAVIANNPLQTALSLLVSMDKYYRDIFKVFSTLQGCRAFLGVTYEEEEFNDEDFIILK